MLREIADLPEALAAVRPDADLAALELIIEIEEEQADGFPERGRGHHQHQPLDAKRREPDGAGDGTGDDGGNQ